MRDILIGLECRGRRLRSRNEMAKGLLAKMSDAGVIEEMRIGFGFCIMFQRTRVLAGWNVVVD